MSNIATAELTFPVGSPSNHTDHYIITTTITIIIIFIIIWLPVNGLGDWVGLPHIAWSRTTNSVPKPWRRFQARFIHCMYFTMLKVVSFFSFFSCSDASIELYLKVLTSQLTNSKSLATFSNALSQIWTSTIGSGERQQTMKGIMPLTTKQSGQPNSKGIEENWHILHLNLKRGGYRSDLWCIVIL